MCLCVCKLTVHVHAEKLTKSIIPLTIEEGDLSLSFKDKESVKCSLYVMHFKSILSHLH